jgi:predicted Ser/Thr protein kinase
MRTNKRETVADYLTYLENKGVEIGYFELHEIKNIDKSCCTNAKTLVIDFDKTKEKIVDAESLITTKSCDCLKIQPEKQCIDLIEMKGFNKFMEHFKGSKIGEKIDENVEKYDLQRKIEDSLHLLNTIVIKKELGRTNDDARFFRDTKINYILLTDVDSINNGKNYFNLAMYFLATHSTSPEKYITAKLEAELGAIPNISHKLNKPMLKTCSEIDAYYAL